MRRFLPLKPANLSQEPRPTHPIYMQAETALYSFAKELELFPTFIDQCLVYLRKVWVSIQRKSSIEQTVLALIYLESRRTKFYIYIRNLVALLPQTYRSKKGASNILNTAGSLGIFLGLKKTIMSFQDCFYYLLNKLKVSPVLFEYVERHRIWIDFPIEQLVFYSSQIFTFLTSKKGLPAGGMNLAGALIFGGNYLLGTSLNLQRGYFRYKDLAKILGRNTSTLSIYHNRYILPLLKSKAFQRKYKQWED